MAFNFSNDTLPRQSGGGLATERPATAPELAVGAAAPAEPAITPVVTGGATSDNPQSASLVRFNSCRWQEKAENGNAAFCTHREVKPYAGTAGFDCDAWCPDCQYYKLRRAPKKRNPNEDYSY